MSSVKRYSAQMDYIGDGKSDTGADYEPRMRENAAGDYTLHSDYAALERECEELRSIRKQMAEIRDGLREEWRQEKTRAEAAEAKVKELEFALSANRTSRVISDERLATAEAKLQRVMEWMRDKGRCGMFCRSSVGMCGTCGTSGFENEDNWTPPKELEG